MDEESKLIDGWLDEWRKWL